MIHALIFVSRFPPSEVAAKFAVSLGIGLLVGIEREWSNKDLGSRTFALTALLGTLAVLAAPEMVRALQTRRSSRRPAPGKPFGNMENRRCRANPSRSVAACVYEKTAPLRGYRFTSFEGL